MRPPDTAAPEVVERRTGSGRSGHRWRGAIAHRLGCAIATGEYAVNEALPPEKQAADALGVSRAAYREAIQYLSGKGMLETKQAVPTRVLPRSRWNLLDPEVLTWIDGTGPGEEIARALFELVEIVVPAAAGMAALRRRSRDLDDLSAAIGSMRRNACSSDARRAADRAFHEVILRATGNPPLMAMTASLVTAAEWSARHARRVGASLHDVVPDCQNVHDALAAQDVPYATRAMQTLLHRSGIGALR